MDFIKKMREDKDLSDILCDVCDVEIFSEFKEPQDENGHLAYNISGKTFAREGTGSEYILLEDGSVGYWGSEGTGGRIADNLQDFFELIINCPYWKDCLYEEEYKDRERLRELAKDTYEEYEEEALESEFNLSESQKKLADSLGFIKKVDVTDVLMKFYNSTKREPRFLQTYTEEDGSTHSGSGSLFD